MASRKVYACQHWPALASIGQHWPALASIGQHWPALASIGQHWPALAITEEILMGYTTEKVKLLYGDCLAVLKELPDNSDGSVGDCMSRATFSLPCL